jgi:hypothetical protein
MAPFMSGSAWAMARDIAQGYIVVTDRVFVRMNAPELDQLRFELDRRLRELRGESPDLEDTQALQLRNRSILRVSKAQTVLQSFRRRRRV